ncbi:zinc finger protein 62 homolog [Toxorhynchites rutilus septentrionalis]|uniref:zinc finger protein 62 homolog n=1 Tax=Toxorhynchites rutilus septentrionalis TaxID=329112 RepID=UPI00247AAFF2|nr:zinc finger protein 62 homolog [Toxorhynchites rutilus septentrionalis]
MASMDAYCRVCMTKDSVELVSLFQIHNGEEEVIANMIIDCTEVMISDDDKLPQNICTECLIRLDNAFELRKQCQRSDVAFRNMLTQTKHVKEEGGMKITIDMKLTDLTENLYRFVETGKYHDVVQITGIRCCGCNAVFNTESELEIHSLNAHKKQEKNPAPHLCPICGQIYPNRNDLMDHGKDVPYSYNVCRLCGLMLGSKIDIFGHLETSHNIIEMRAESNHKVISFDAADIVCPQTDEEHEIEYLDEAEDLEFVDKVNEERTDEQQTADDGEDALTDRADSEHESKMPNNVFIDSIDDLPCHKVYHLRGERCCGCYEMFDDIEKLKNHCELEHSISYSNKQKHQCKACNRCFKNNAQLEKHIQSANQKTIYYCKLCDLILTDDSKFTSHIVLTNDHDEAISSSKIGDKFEEISAGSTGCCGCDVVCDSEVELRRHIEEEHSQKLSSIDNEDQFECNRCFDCFPTSHQLTLHKAQAQNRLYYQCRTEDCGYRTPDKKQIVKHVTTTNAHRDLSHKQPTKRKKKQPKDDNMTCCVARCYETFNSYEELQIHAETAHELLRIQHTQSRKSENTACDICFKGFENVQAYTRHRMVDRTRKHVCLTCGAQYVSKSNLIQHERSNCGKIATFQCTQCDKAFVTVGGLKNHQEVHGNKRSFVCDICGRAFLRKSVLNDHMNTVHSTLRLFKCSLCPKSFASRNIFQSHQLTHTKERPYQCRYCDKRYFKTSDRTLHENQVHLGIRPFQCSFCSSSFIRDRERRLHERIHTKSKLYTCDICSGGYNKFSEFKQHRLDEHGIETLRDLGPTVMAALNGDSVGEIDNDSCIEDVEQSGFKMEIDIHESVYKDEPINLMDHNHPPMPCRVCKGPSEVSLFNDDDGSNMARLMSEFADIPIVENDGKPSRICNDCAEKLRSAVAFRKRIQESERLLEILCGNNSSRDISNVKTETTCNEEIEYEYEFLDECSNDYDKDSEDSKGFLHDVLDDFELNEDQTPSELALQTRDEVQEENKDMIKFPFDMPPEKLIARRINFDHFEYLELNGDRCCGCSFIAADRDELVQHSKAKHSHNYYPDSSYTCPTCYQKFKTQLELTEHIEYYSYSDIFLCTMCNESFIEKSHLLTHQKNILAHRSLSYVNVDGKKTNNVVNRKPYSARTGHIINRKSLRNDQTDSSSTHYCCFVRCWEGFDSRDKLMSHVQEAHEGKRRENELARLQQDPQTLEHTCPVCQRVFENDSKLILHQSYKQNRDTHICQECGRCFYKAHILRDHEQKEHSQQEPEHKCEVCGKMFWKLSGLKHHRKIHVAFESVPCTEAGCKLVFRDEMLMKRHCRNVHGAFFPWECRFCPKKLRTKEAMDIHVRVHTGEKPFACRQGCDRRFAHATDRARHERSIHTGEKPHKCNQCPAAYVRKRELILHLQKQHRSDEH